MRLPHLCCLLALVTVLFSSQRALGQDMDEIKARAGELTSDGQVLLKGGRFLEAAVKFREAYERVPHPVLLYNQGICHRLAGNRFTARDYYRKYLAVQSEGDLADLSRKFIAELDASIEEDPTPDPNPEEAKPAEDNKPPLHVSELPEEQPKSVVTESAPVSPLAASVTQATAKRRRMTPLTWSLAGVSLVSLGVGTYFSISGYSGYSDCKDRGTCETNEEVDDIDTKLLVGDVLIGVGLASAVATGVLYWLSEEEVPSIGVTTSASATTVHYRLEF